MLILYRRTNEEVILKIPGYEDVTLKFLRVDANSVRLGIDAEKRIVIMRSELLTDQPDVAFRYEARLQEEFEHEHDKEEEPHKPRFYKANAPRTRKPKEF